VCLLTILEQTPVSDNIAIESSVFYGTCPAYLTNIVEPAGAGRTRSGLPSTSFTDYTLPRLRTKFAERAFSYAGPSAWNGLSEDLRAVADPVEFRKHLKTHFFTAAHNVYWHPLSLIFYVLAFLFFMTVSCNYCVNLTHSHMKLCVYRKIFCVTVFLFCAFWPKFCASNTLWRRLTETLTVSIG